MFNFCAPRLPTPLVLSNIVYVVLHRTPVNRDGIRFQALFSFALQTHTFSRVCFTLSILRFFSQSEFPFSLKKQTLNVFLLHRGAKQRIWNDKNYTRMDTHHNKTRNKGSFWSWCLLHVCMCECVPASLSVCAEGRAASEMSWAERREPIWRWLSVRCRFSVIRPSAFGWRRGEGGGDLSGNR